MSVQEVHSPQLSSQLNPREYLPIKSIIPYKYKRTLSLVDQVSKEQGIPYAILGNIGVGATCQIPLAVVDYEGPWSVGYSDVDVFLLGNDKTRANFIAAVRSLLPVNSPLVDFTFGHHQNIGFDEGGNPFLRYRKIRIPLSTSLFELFKRSVDDIEVLVLNPRTYLEMIRLANNRKYPERTLVRINNLLSGVQSYPYFSDELIEPFYQFETEIRHKYPLRYPFIDLRRNINSISRLSSIISTLRETSVMRLIRRSY